MFVILLVFLVCYAPFTIFTIVRAIVLSEYKEVDDYSDQLWWVCHWLAYLNSALNPLIYGLTNKEFVVAWRASCPDCGLSRRISVDGSLGDRHSCSCSSRPQHSHRRAHTPEDGHHPHAHTPEDDLSHLDQLDSCYERRPRTPLAIEALRGNGSPARTSRSSGQSERTPLIYWRRSSPVILSGGSSLLQATPSQASGSPRHTQNTDSRDLDIFATETSKYPLSFVNVFCGRSFTENGQMSTL
nr:beta-1 adrenergic receptor-like [Procambarus clarkii]